jgi:hypothetical protein
MVDSAALLALSAAAAPCLKGFTSTLTLSTVQHVHFRADESLMSTSVPLVVERQPGHDRAPEFVTAYLGRVSTATRIAPSSSVAGSVTCVSIDPGTDHADDRHISSDADLNA